MFIVVHDSSYIGPFETKEEALKYIKKKVSEVKREYEEHSDIRPDPLVIDDGWSPCGTKYSFDVYDPFDNENSTYTWYIEELTNPQ